MIRESPFSVLRQRWYTRRAAISAQIQFEPRYWLLGVSWDFYIYRTVRS